MLIGITTDAIIVHHHLCCLEVWHLPGERRSFSAVQRQTGHTCSLEVSAVVLCMLIIITTDAIMVYHRLCCLRKDSAWRVLEKTGHTCRWKASALVLCMLVVVITDAVIVPPLRWLRSSGVHLESGSGIVPCCLKTGHSCP